MERKQNLRSVTGKKKRYVMIACIAVMLVLAAVLIIYAATHEKKSFHQPEMDSHAVEGTPQPDSGFLYGEVPTKYAYHFSMAANLYMQPDQSVYVYFTNASENTELLRCEITDAKSEKVLYESGVIKPGTYIEKLSPTVDLDNTARDITVKVYAYKDGSWYSAGTTIMIMKLQPW